MARSPSRDSAPLASWTALVDVYQSVLHYVVGALERDAAMDSGVFSVLALLARAQPPHRAPLADLQRAMYPRYSQPGLSRLVQRMEADGLVTREADPADGRASVVVTTRHGRRRHDEANAVYRAVLRRSFGRHLSGDEHAALTALLDSVTARRTDSVL